MKKIICIILITVTSILSGCNSTSDEEINIITGFQREL